MEPELTILVNMVTFLGAKARFQITLIIYVPTCRLRVDFSAILRFEPIWLLESHDAPPI
jgi:hypothetical protein